MLSVIEMNYPTSNMWFVCVHPSVSLCVCPPVYVCVSFLNVEYTMYSVYSVSVFLVYTPLDLSCNGLCLVSFPCCLTQWHWLTLGMLQWALACLSSTRKLTPASICPSCLPSMHILALWPCLFLHVYSSVSNFLSFDSATSFGFYRSSLSRALVVLNDVAVLDCMSSFFSFPCMELSCGLNMALAYIFWFYLIFLNILTLLYFFYSFSRFMF